MIQNQQILSFIQTARKLKRNQLVSEGCNKGSMSLLIDENTIAISPSKLDYDELSVEQVNIMNIDGTFVSKPSPASRDSSFHLAIYQARKDVKAIIHTHSTYATSLALVNKGIPYITVGMKFHCKGSVDIVPFDFPDSPGLNEQIIKHLSSKNAVLIQNHGLICVGQTLADCYETTEFVEDLSESYVHALLMGGVDLTL